MCIEMLAYTKIRSAATRSSSGMTLIELIIVIPILLIVGIIIAALFYNYVNMFIAHNDMVAAAQRADSVLRLLEAPVLHAGLGVNTATSDDYRRAWNENNERDHIENSPPPAYWDDAVRITFDGNGTEAAIRDGGNEAGIVYSVSTRIKLQDGAEIADNNATTLRLISGDLPALDFPNDASIADRAGNMQSWVSVPGTDTAVPMLVERDGYKPGDATLAVRVLGKRPGSDARLWLPMFQDIYRMKAVWAYVDQTTHTFNLVEFASDGSEPPATVADRITVERIRAIRFKLSDDRKYMEVRVLAMGDTVGAVHSQSLAPSLRARWSELTDDDARHHLEEFSVKWRVRNLGEQN